MTTYGFGKNKGKREVYTKEEVGNVTVDMTLADGFQLVEAAENRCIYNKLTKQCTLYFRINGSFPEGTTTTIMTIPVDYRPSKYVYGNVDFNGVGGFISINSNGEVQVKQYESVASLCRGQITWVVDGQS